MNGSFTFDGVTSLFECILNTVEQYVTNIHSNGFNVLKKTKSDLQAVSNENQKPDTSNR